MEVKYLIKSYGRNISPSQVMRCYRLNPKECRLIYKDSDLYGLDEGKFITLTERPFGDYLEHLEKNKETYTRLIR